MKTKTTATCLTILLSTTSTPALAGHLFTQNVNNTPTWIQEGQGVRIDQTRMESASGGGQISIDFAANPTPPEDADTSTADWWAWSSGDVLRFTVPTADGEISTTIAYDATPSCEYDACGGYSSSFSGSLPAIGTTSMALGQSDVGEETPLTWTVEALAGQFSLAGYRISFANGRLNGTGAAPLDQTSVVDSGDLDGDSTPDIDTSQGSYNLSDLEEGDVTSTFEGGTLTVDAPDEVANDFLINEAGGTIDTNGLVATLAGKVSGAGGLTKSGAGTLSLTGENTYAGGTTVSAGTLQVASNANLGDPSGALTLDGGALGTTAAFDLARPVVLGAGGGTLATGADLTVSGTIGGAGGLAKTGGGTLTLSGANTYAGGTTVTGGTVLASSNANLGDTSGALTLDGGALGTTVAFNLARPLVIGSDGATLGTGSNGLLSLAGPVTGSGALGIAGNVALGGPGFAHQGAINVTGGALLLNGSVTSQSIVSDMGTLIGGAGTLSGSLDIAGLLSPGNSPGTMTVASDVTLAPTATSRFEIDGRVYAAAGGAGTYDRLVLTGEDAVFTADGTVAPVLRGISGDATNSFVPVIGDSFRVVVTANETGIAGAFADIDQPDAGLAPGQRFAVFYGGDYIDLVIAPTTFLDFAEALDNDNVIAAAEAVDRAVATGTAESLPLTTGLYGLAPGPLAVALEQTSGEIHAFALDSVRSGIVQSARALGEAVIRKPRHEMFWIDASGAWSESGETDSNSAYDESGGHLWVGRDLYHAASVRAGLAFGYVTHDVDTDFDASADADTYLVAAYAAGEHGGLVFDAMLAGARSQFDTTRTLDLSSDTYIARGSGDVGSAILGLGLAHRHPLGAGLDGRAWARLVATAMDADGYEESGSDIADLDIDDGWVGGSVTGLGYEVGGNFDATAWHVGLGVEQTSGRVARDLSLFGESWRVAAADAGVVGVATAGLSFQPTENSTLAIDLEFRDGDDWQSRSVGASYSIVW